MTNTFPVFAAAVHERFTEMSKHELYVVQTSDLFETYLSAFPEGTNPIFRERTEHDCSCCKNFVRNIGNVVCLNDDGSLGTIWDVEGLPEPYATVAATLAARVRQEEIAGVYRTKMSSYGAETTKELRDEGVHTWHHFHGKIARKHQHTEPATEIGRFNSAAQVFGRGLKELSMDALTTVQDLIADNAIYRGAEFKAAIDEFIEIKMAYDAASPTQQRAMVWQKLGSRAALMRNTVIGTLVQDLSEGVDVERAVRSFETKVAPANYKRPTALITPKMIEAAMKTLHDLGLEQAVERRYAKISDVSVNNVLFVDNAARPMMRDALTEKLMAVAKTAPTKVENATEIDMESFLRDVVPTAKEISLQVENKHQGNFMSLTAPVHENTGRLFQWDNDFAWSYDGDVTDTDIRQAVQARGGRVDGVFRFSHSWNYAKRNASLMDLHVFMPKNATKADNGVHDRYGNDERVGWNNRHHYASGGSQDVDYTSAAPSGYVPVENITFPSLSRMPDGEYICKIHNWQFRDPTQGGFRAEIEFGGQVFEYDYDKPLKHKEWVTVAVVTLKKGAFTIEHKIPCGSAPQDKWGVKTETLVPVDTLLLSPNHWDGQEKGNKHWFFILKDCKRPGSARGIYNEFLRGDLAQHRKVFEVLGAQTKCEPSDDQLSGVGFSSTRGDRATVVVKTDKSNRAYNIQF